MTAPSAKTPDKLTMISHDLRNDLGTVLTTVSALLITLPPDAEGRNDRRQVEAIRRSAERMHQLLGELLDVASVESRRLLGPRGREGSPAQREKSTFGASAAPGVCNSK